MKLFVDDAKVKKIVKPEEDVEELQENLNTLCKWEEENPMKFNGAKFQLLFYGTDLELKNNTVYFTGKWKKLVTNFHLSETLVLECQMMLSLMSMLVVPIKVRQKIGWIFRTFYT